MQSSAMAVAVVPSTPFLLSERDDNAPQHARGNGTDCQMEARTACKPHDKSLPPAFRHVPAALPPFSSEVASLTSVRVGGSSLLKMVAIAVA